MAGGLGSRLRTVVSDVPKPMAPIRGRPFLAYQLEYWINQGVSRFILSVGYKHEVISDYFGEQYLGAKIEYVIESIPLGTGGGLLLAAQQLNHDDCFLLLNGDTYFEVSLQHLMTFAQETDADWCFSLFSTTDVKRYMGMDVAPNGRIHAFHVEKKQESVLANGGVYWIHPRVFQYINIEQEKKYSLEEDILPTLLTTQCRFFGKEFSAAFIDIGIPEDYCRSELLLA